MPAFFRSLLYLYPPAYRQEYGDEMLSVLDEVQAGVRRRGAMSRVISLSREAGGLLRGALREHLRAIYSPQSFPDFSPRRLSMRSEFRFPKATVTLMTIILLAVGITIDKAKSIQESVPSSSTPVGPIHPVHFTIVATFLVVFALVCAGGVLVWAVLFALNRSGAQRLSNLKPSTEPRSSNSLLG